MRMEGCVVFFTIYMCKLKTILQGDVRKVITLSSRLTSHYAIRIWPFEVQQQAEAAPLWQPGECPCVTQQSSFILDADSTP